MQVMSPEQARVLLAAIVDDPLEALYVLASPLACGVANC
jgi:hypothetical protein